MSGQPAPGVLKSTCRRSGGHADKGSWDGASLWPTPPRRSSRLADARRRPTTRGELEARRARPGLLGNADRQRPPLRPAELDIEAARLAKSKEITVALQPAPIIEGRVLAADTGQPIPNAVIAVRASYGAFGGMFTTKFRADDQGRFKISPYAGDYFRMRVFPPEGQPYLVGETEFAWTKGAVKKEIDLKLAPRRADPRQGDRRGDWPAGGRRQRPFVPKKPGAETRQLPARTMARSSSPCRPVRDT